MTEEPSRPARPPPHPPFDLAVVGGTVFDGLGSPPRTDQTVAVRAGRITLLAAGSPADARRTVDASGRFVAPGFIDIHSHSDFAGLAFPLAQSKVLSGITTEINGNCGMSAFPLSPELRERRRAEYARSGVAIHWTDLAGYRTAAEGVGSSINRGLQVGHGNLRTSAMGYAARPADAAERRTMRRLLEDALAGGCLGMSSGLFYPPGTSADADELSDLARIVAVAGGFYSSHLRSEDDALLEAVDEFLAVVRAGGVRGQYSHVKTALPRNWPKIGPLRDRLFAARAEGLDFACDRYPYTALCTGLDSVLLPGWANEGGPSEALRRLADPDGRRRIADAVRTLHPEPDFLDAVVIASVHGEENLSAVGRTLREWAALRGSDPLSAAFDLLVEEAGRVECIHFAMSEDNLVEILGWPFTLIGSDHSVRAAVGAVRRGARPHPRAYGTPSRFLTDYVRGRRLMSWEEGIRRMTGACAAAAGLSDRGVIRDGAAADLVVFDPAALTDRATYDEPRLPPTGIDLVVVNGEIVVERGTHTGRRPGRILTR